MTHSKSNALGALIVSLLLSFCTAGICLGADTVGGWEVETKPKPKPGEKPETKPEAKPEAKPAGPTYPEDLRKAIDTFSALIQKDKEALDAAKAVLEKKIKTFLDTEEPKLLKTLKAEVPRMIKADRLKDAKACKAMIKNYEPGSIDWSKVPSRKIASDYKRVLTRLTMLKKSEQRKIQGKRSRLENTAKTKSKSILRDFDKLITSATKAGDLDLAIAWKGERHKFLTLLPAARINDPSLILHLKFDPSFVSSKTVMDLSAQQQVGSLEGKVKFVEVRGVGGCMQFEGGHIAIPANPKFAIGPKDDFTLFALVKPMKHVGKVQAIARYSKLDGTQYGLLLSKHNNYFIYKSSKAKAAPKWTTMVCIQKGGQRYLFVDGKMIVQTYATDSPKTGGFYIGGGAPNMDFLGQIREVRLYRRAMSKTELAKLFTGE